MEPRLNYYDKMIFKIIQEELQNDPSMAADAIARKWKLELTYVTRAVEFISGLRKLSLVLLNHRASVV